MPRQRKPQNGGQRLWTGRVANTTTGSTTTQTVYRIPTRGAHGECEKLAYEVVWTAPIRVNIEWENVYRVSLDMDAIETAIENMNLELSNVTLQIVNWDVTFTGSVTSEWEFTWNVVNATTLNAETSNLETANVDNLVATDSQLTNATITSLTATSWDVTTLTSTNATVTNLTATNWNVADLTAAEATITNWDVANLTSANATLTDLTVTGDATVADMTSTWTVTLNNLNTTWDVSMDTATITELSVPWTVHFNNLELTGSVDIAWTLRVDWAINGNNWMTIDWQIESDTVRTTEVVTDELRVTEGLYLSQWAEAPDFVLQAEKWQPNWVAPLDVNWKVDPQYLPPVYTTAIVKMGTGIFSNSDTSVVVDEAITADSFVAISNYSDIIWDLNEVINVWQLTVVSNQTETGSYKYIIVNPIS